MENYKKMPSMGFSESVKSVLSNLLNFNGRSRRSELWWYYLAYILVAMALNLMLTPFPILLGVIATVLQLTLWAVTVRRLHDRGHSGWWVTAAILISVFAQFYMDAAMAALRSPVFTITGLVSIIVNLTIFVFCVLDGKPEPNKYGISTKYVPEDAI